MSSTAAGLDALVHAVLYEGYALYPYRPSALKNAKRFAFGVVYPSAWAARALEADRVRVEIVVAPTTAAEGAGASLAVTVRYLQLARAGGAHEQTIALPAFELGEPPRTEHVARDDIELVVELSAVPCADGLWKFAIELVNATALPPGADYDDALDRSPASTHVILTATGAEVMSAIDPPPHAAASVAACRCLGLYPIVVGAAVDGTMLASPIILPDRPEISPHSPGSFFDGTEIDEMLTLRVLTMTDDEKREAAAADPRIAELIARTEALGIEQTARLHGVVRTSWPRVGSSVRVHPSVQPGRRADAFDALLAGKLATVAAVERDLEGRIYCAVTIDDDPGAALGAAGMPGHRFFFSPDELEVIA